MRYVDWEMNLDSLRQTRASRLGVKNKAYYAGQRRPIFIMDRAVRRYPGDVGLWIRSVDVARKLKSYKKITEILTSMVRLHPNKPEVWTFVASYAIDDLGDMGQARVYMQRGLRFCKNSRDLWLDYFKLEMSYIAKLVARRSILGLDKQQEDQAAPQDDAKSETGFISLPAITAAEWEEDVQDRPVIDNGMHHDLRNNPALTGAIPRAVFNAAMDNFSDVKLAARFFDICAVMHEIDCSKALASDITDRMVSTAPKDPNTVMATVRQPLLGVKASSIEFPQSLGISLAKLSASMRTSPNLELAHSAIAWISSIAAPELDPDIQKVISTVTSRLYKHYRDQAQRDGDTEAGYAQLLQAVQDTSIKDLVPKLAEEGLETWPSSSVLVKLSGAMDVTN